MFFTSTGHVYHVCTDYTEFEFTSYHLHGKMRAGGKVIQFLCFSFEGGLKHAGTQMNNSVNECNESCCFRCPLCVEASTGHMVLFVFI